VNSQAVVSRGCAVCGSEVTRTVGGRLLCDSATCHQVLGTRNQDQDQVGSKGRGRGLRVVPGAPGGNLPERSEPELRGLVRDHEQGRLHPAQVDLGDLPPPGRRVTDFKGEEVVVTDATHAVAADIRLLLGLRLAVNEDRPLPYSTRFCAERCRLRDHRHASRVLRALERTGVVICAGTMKPRGKPDGTKLYAAPGATRR
jgi:hypothetical protein